MKQVSKLVLGLIFILMLGIVAACSSGGTTSSGSSQGSTDSAKTETKDTAEQGEKVVLKLSHQWPKATTEEGDFRSQLAEKFGAEVEKRTNGAVTIQQYPASSLVKATDQYDAMFKGALDMSVFPFDYAGGKIPQFGITLMPAMVKNHQQAIAWENAEIGKMIEEIAEENGMKILVWVWNAGAIGSKGDPVVSPSDVRSGMQIRAAGNLVEEMLASAGAGIASMASSEIYSALQTNILDAAVTSNSSHGSYKLYEQIDSFTTSLENTFWFMFEPLVISTKSWEKLTPEQQTIFEEVAAELQPWAYQASEDDDIAVAELFKEKGINVVDMDDASYQEWVELSKPIWEGFAEKVDRGAELLEAAKAVQEQ
ncbi:C4-dicarboxylate ABC transporter substrate-binding protein [bacterium LRH843]|nr:C4-dicarboxylate ABC transporter substrate-binding protein [bacterium LRH843]